MIFSENRYLLFRIMLFGWSMIFVGKPAPTFPDHALIGWSMIFSENRYPLFRIML